MASEFADSESSNVPFSKIIDFKAIKGKSVRIGCGMDLIAQSYQNLHHI